MVTGVDSVMVSGAYIVVVACVVARGNVVGSSWVRLDVAA